MRAIGPAQSVDAGAHEVGVVLFSNCAHSQWIFRYKQLAVHPWEHLCGSSKFFLDKLKESVCSTGTVRIFGMSSSTVEFSAIRRLFGFSLPILPSFEYR